MSSRFEIRILGNAFKYFTNQSAEESGWFVVEVSSRFEIPSAAQNKYCVRLGRGPCEAQNLFSSFVFKVKITRRSRTFFAKMKRVEEKNRREARYGRKERRYTNDGPTGDSTVFLSRRLGSIMEGKGSFINVSLPRPRQRCSGTVHACDTAERKILMLVIGPPAPHGL